jgi:uncharacterized SAM-binding protein YcdF (DUF218 family)
MGRLRIHWLRRAVFGTLLMLLLVIGGTALRVWQVARADDRERADIILVLGAAQYNGKPSAIFEARLRHAKQLYQEGVAKTIVTTGGNRVGDNYTEAYAGLLWLRAAGVPTADTFAVAEGSDTLGSLRATAAEAHRHAWHTAVLVSDPWHSLRARTMADDQGLQAWTSPTHSGPIVRTRLTQLRYIYRETGALLFYLTSKTPADDIGGSGYG